MSKFNKPVPGTAPQTLVTAAPKTGKSYIQSASQPVYVIPSDTRTANGAPGWTRDAKGELFLLAVSNMVSEGTFYEGASARDKRFRELVRQVTQQDSDWVARFVPWLRNEANMRTASVVAAVEAAQVWPPLPGCDERKCKALATWVVQDENFCERHRPSFCVRIPTARTTVSSALRRADEPGEALAYIKARGYKLSGGLQRGIADAATRLFNERNLLKYDGQSRDFRFGDVLELTHASPDAPWQGDLFKLAIDRRHNREGIELPESLTMLKWRKELEAMPVEQRRALVATQDPRIGLAGMTWESLSGWLQGPMDKAAWEAIIPEMGYMALLRNLRNFDQAGVSDGVAARVAERLADPEQVAKSRQLPMRFLSAYNAAPSLRWSWTLEQALGHSLSNVPVLKGRTLIEIDTSGSMNSSFSKDGTLKFWEAAALFGIALASRAESADVISFSNNDKAFPLVKGESVLAALTRFRQGYFFGGGTATAASVQRNFRNHDRVVILTDEQADGYSYYGHGSVDKSVPQTTPLYNFNLAGYRAGSTPAGNGNRHTFGGLTDSGFKLLALLESGKSGEWPF